MRYLIALPVAIAVGLALGRWSRLQAEPQVELTGFRWRILHGERFGPSAMAQVLLTLFLLWSGWVEIMAVLWVVGGRPLGWWMIEGPAVANLVALVAVPLMLRGSWTEIDADPVRLRLRRPWWLRSRELPWEAVSNVAHAGKTLIIEAHGRRFELDAPQASLGSIVAAARWLEAGRRAPFPPAPPPEPTPPELAAIVSRAGARSAPRAVAE